MESKDRTSETLLEALAQALAVPGEHRLYRAGKLEGLFPSKVGAVAEAASQALTLGLLERTRTETKGKTEIDWVRITPRGVEYLHDHRSPVHALHELRDVLRANQEAVPLWLADMQQQLTDLGVRLRADAGRWVERLAGLERQVSDTLRRLEAAAPLLPQEVAEAHPWAIDALNYLDRRRASGGVDDCPLPELFAAVLHHHPELSLTAFHDGLRRLHQRRAVLLKPANDPMTMTQPEFALLEGDCVFYFAVR